MLAILIASTLAAASDSPSVSEHARKMEPVRQCRIVAVGISRSSDITICRTKAQWRARDMCGGPTRFCTPQQKAEMSGKRTAFSMSEDSRVICRVLMGTGSRLSSQRVCLPQREWQRMWDDSSAGTRKLQDQSTRVTGQQ